MTEKAAIVTGASRGIGAAVARASTEVTGFVTGTTLTIDGGRLAGTPPYQVKAGPR